ncbi:MAG: phenylalanine--tRNA ligase subunit beta, partial [Pseudomonadota bacterium]|nr:phenylalanine--tRNA ligase subunit beta [Pseudomonadota bacterium]
ERATALILSICGGHAGPLSDVTALPLQRPAVRVRPARVRRLLGVDVASAFVATSLRKLGCTVEAAGGDWLVTPPTYRFDLAIEEDFVEEVARLHGYDRIPAVASAHVHRMLPASEGRRTPVKIKERLAIRDWQEVITFSFVSSVQEQLLFPERDAEEAPIGVLNPIASHLDVMRTTLAVGLLEVLRTNLAHRQDRIRIFELGRCFHRSSHGDRQTLRLGGLAYGDAIRKQWDAGARAVDLFDVKGDLQAVVAPLMVTTCAAPHPALHPGRSATISVDGHPAGWIGELHPRILQRLELPAPPVLFEIDVALLTEVPCPRAQPISALPRVRRDLSVVVDEAIPVQELLSALAVERPGQVESLQLFDVYRGPSLGHGKKSVAILVVMQDTERTLTESEIEAAMASLLQVVITRFNGALRQ